jgi:hypothetical protein
MRRAVLVLVGVSLLAGCGGDDDTAAPVGVAPTAEQAGEPIEIRTEVTIVDEEGAETIATGEVLEGSTLGDSPFCVGGTIIDTHPTADVDPAYLIEREITCPGGTVTIGLTPEGGYAAGRAPGRLVGDRRRLRRLRGTERGRRDGGRLRPRRRLACPGDAQGHCNYLDCVP